MADLNDIKRAAGGRDVWNAWALEHLRDGTTHDVDFSGAQLTVTSFEGFIFPGNANFFGASFQQRTTFRRAWFGRAANFSSATFEQGAVFSFAQFQGDAFFSGAKFVMRASLDRMVFHRDANLNNTRFEQSAYLAHTIFNQYANFRCSRFDSRLVLTNATFNGETRFDRASIGDSFFNSISVTHHIINFKRATFSRAPDFRAAKFVVPPNMERIIVEFSTPAYRNEPFLPRLAYRLGQRAGRGEDAAKFRRLKDLASEAKDHERELDFFAKELKAKRFYETRAFGPILLSVAYQFFSNFGLSIERPVFALLALIVLAAAVILCNYAPAGTDHAITVLGVLVASVLCRVTGSVRFAWLFFVTAVATLVAWSPPALVLALSNSVPFLGPSSWWNNCSGTAAFDAECEPRALPALLAGVQNVLSVVLVFLIGLGLRNRFRIGG